ncbi:MAG TPA: hypothetical protein VF950_23955 [Planctomycetota bacterium]
MTSLATLLLCALSALQDAVVTVDKPLSVVGGPLRIDYRAGNTPADRRIDAAVVDLSNGAEVWTKVVGDRPAGTLACPAPKAPGDYEVRLTADKKVLASARLAVEVTPTPGAIKTDRRIYQAGQPLVLTVKLPEGRFYDLPWVGLFTPGRLAHGGAAVGWRMSEWWRFGAEPLKLTAPPEPGSYEFRLFDRDGWQYQIDALTFEVVVDRAPGALVMENRKAPIGLPITVAVRLPKDRYLNLPWVGLQEDDGGPEYRQTHVWARVSDGQVVIPGPRTAGAYRLRLYDRHYAGFILDELAFTAIATPAPGALTMPKTEVLTGEPMEVTVRIPENRFRDWPRVGIYTKAPDAASGAARRPDRLEWLYVGADGTCKVRAPLFAGAYVMRLFDRNDESHLLDELEFSVAATPVPGAIALDAAEVAAGQDMTATIRLPAGRFYDWPCVYVVRQGFKTRGGALVAEHGQERFWVKPDAAGVGVVRFKAPAAPGAYELRLHDREAPTYALDAAPFTVAAPPRSVNLALGAAPETPKVKPGHKDRAVVRRTKGSKDKDGNPEKELTLDRYDRRAGAAAAGKKLADLHLKLREILEKPQEEWTANDAREVATLLTDLLPDRFEGFKTFLETNLGRAEKVGKIIKFAQDAQYILSPDPNDPLWELKAFRRYLGLMDGIAGEVPGIGPMYGQYVEGVDAMVKDAETINQAKNERNHAIRLFSDVVEGRYPDPGEKERVRELFDEFNQGLDEARQGRAPSLTRADAANIESASRATYVPWNRSFQAIREAVGDLNAARGALKKELQEWESMERAAERQKKTLLQLYGDARMREQTAKREAARLNARAAQSALNRESQREPGLRRAYLEDHYTALFTAQTRIDPELARLDGAALRRRAVERAAREAALPIRETEIGVTVPDLVPDPEAR